MKFLTLLPLLAFAACSTAPPRAARQARPQAQPSIPNNLAVREQSPARLVLTDNSPWQVQPAGQSASLRWRPGEPIAVIRSGHPAWPFLLTSRYSHTAALARPFPRF